MWWYLSSRETVPHMTPHEASKLRSYPSAHDHAHKPMVKQARWLAGWLATRQASMDVTKTLYHTSAYHGRRM